MKKRKLGSVAVIVALSFGLVLTAGVFESPRLQADEITDTQNNITNLEKKKQEMQETLEELEKKKDDVIEYVSELDQKLTQLEEEIEKLDGQIETLNAQLEVTQEELAQAKKTEEDQYNAMLSRIKYNYENGSTSYLSLLFESDSVVDFLNNAVYAKKMAEFDQNMYDAYKAAKEAVAQKEQELEAQIAELEDLKETQEYEKQSVEDLLEQKNAELEQYNNDIAKSEEEIESFTEQIKKNEEQLEALILEEQRKAEEAERRRKEEEERRRKEAEAQNNNGTESGETPTEVTAPANTGNSSYIWPCPASHRITSYFGPRTSPTAGASSYHKGIDIGAAAGSSILAARSGTVVTATYSSSCGNYVMISHGGGVYTLYMHASVLLVSVGDYVNQGDVIARVGSTGISTGPHLHFAVTIDGTYVNPLSFVSP